jgi:hypothetical protein
MLQPGCGFFQSNRNPLLPVGTQFDNQNTLICFEMFLMAIASGLAYNYENYISRSRGKTGNILLVISDTIRSFKDDFRLIKPKVFGFQVNNNERET